MLVEFADIYRLMGKLGWSPVEVDAMEVWQVGMFLGPDGDDPVIRGSRQLVTRSDSNDDDGRPTMRPGPGGDPTLAARIAAAKRRQQGQEATAT